MDMNPRFPDPQLLNCPRCDSTNTKFCYYNNYNLSQPRHYCKNCRRYWTKGGTLRNIPVGGATRKITKRSKRTSTSSLPPPPPIPPPPPAAAVVNLNLLSTTTTTNTTTTTTTTSNNHITSNNRIDYPMGPFGNLLMEGLNFNLVNKSNNNHDDDDVLIRNPMIRNPIADDFRTNFLRLNDNSGTERGESSCWNGGETGWPDLSIFTPGSTFH